MTHMLLPLLLLAAAPAAVDEAQFQHFLRALPPASQAAPSGPDPAEVRELVALNPGREADVRAVLVADAACTAPVSAAAVATMARGVAAELGPERLGRMIAFYEGPDYPAIDRLMTRAARGETLSPADQAEMARIKAAYPLEAFAKAMQASGQAIWSDPAAADGFAKCAEARAAAMERAKLRAY